MRLMKEDDKEEEETVRIMKVRYYYEAPVCSAGALSL